MAEDIFYTDEVLNEMFRSIADGFDHIDKHFVHIGRHFAHLEGHISELSKRSRVIAKAPKGGKLKTLVTCVAVGYVAYQVGSLVSEVRKEVAKGNLKVERTTPDEAQADPDPNNTNI